MYIAKVLSNLGGWEKLHNNHPGELNEIIDAIRNSKIPSNGLKDKRHQSNHNLVSIGKIKTQINRYLENLNWRQKDIFFGRESERGISNIDVFKSGIGLEVGTGKHTFIESDIFVKFPLFFSSGIVEIGVMVVLVKSIAKTGSGISSFEMIRRRVKEITPFVPKYPFVILGISDIQAEAIREEVTSDFDSFLFENIGLTYAELKLQQERLNCDFKVTLQPNGDKVAAELCAFANTLGGGVLLIGLDNNGNKVGFPIVEKDKLQTRIGNIAKDSCHPSLVVRFKSFEVEGDKSKCILAVRIFEIEKKPCMSQGRIYIRDNAAAVPANPDQVRRLLLGSLG